ncbi:MAG: hypothetical protein E4H14_05540 [Candidatus Thorarchaeota archaeon]|nr:MAG: hypothetical protein E4H14_05540 [Candidatus Thorarchaeota archaeon]
MAFPKNKTGYVITRSRSAGTYFTSSAAYDRPDWVQLTEATVYASPELAQSAAKHLWRNGAFAASVVPLQELVNMELELPPQEDGKERDDQDSEMVAVKQNPEDELDGELRTGDVDGDDIDGEDIDGEEVIDDEIDGVVDGDETPSDVIPTDAGQDEDPEAELSLDVEQEEDTMLGQHLKSAAGMENNERSFMSPEESKMMGGKRRLGKMAVETHKVGSKVIPHIGPHKGVPHEVIHVHDDGTMNIRPIGLSARNTKYRLGAVRAKADQVKLHEETVFKMPPKGDDPAQPTENKTTVTTMKVPKSEIIKYDDPAETADKPETDLCYATAHEHDETFNVPQEIKSRLKAVIDDFVTAAEADECHDDVRGSFELTAASALQQILDDLDQGTVEGVKQAQIHMASYMNPITSHIPAEVAKFIMYGGRKSSLKNYFDVKWEQMRGVK